MLWGEEFGFSINWNSAPRFAIKCLYFCCNAGNKSVKKPLRGIDAPSPTPSATNAQTDKASTKAKKDGITTTLHFGDLLCTFPVLSPSFNRILFSFLEIIFPSWAWLIKAFTLPTVEAKEVEISYHSRAGEGGQVN